jgi:RNA polymerase sigma factor (sigma-70 family)
MAFQQVPNGLTHCLEMEISADEVSSSLQQLFESLYDEHHDALYRYLVLTGSSQADADEFVQEAYLRLLQALQQADAVRNPKHWLFRVAHNLRADSFRDASRRTAVHAGEAKDESPADLGPDPEAALLLSERDRRLAAALAQLTQRQCEILHMRAEGLKLREIADLLGITLQTVSETCARAVERVGRLLDE